MALLLSDWAETSLGIPMLSFTGFTELSGFAGEMGVAHRRPALQTQEGLGENSKGFLSFYFQPETFTFSNPHCGLQRVSIII